jgi:glycerophosphoryl diester phosphodiesterase
MKPWPYPRWIAHRGAGKLAPENTLAAFRLGAVHGYRMFECDAKLSADGVPFLLHDATLDRTTDGHGVASDLTWHHLSQLDAGHWHSHGYAGESLPTLEALAHWCLANGHFLNIEIKPTPGQEHPTGQAIAALAQRLWRDAPVPPFLTSFQIASLQAAQAIAPNLPRGLLLDTLWDGWLEAAHALDCVAVVCHYPLWTVDAVTRVRSAGMRCISYTVNDATVAQHLIALGTDGLITDRIDLLGPD